MLENDVLWMTAVVFLPTAFALVLLFFPRGSEEGMRWWTLLGTALTLGASIGMFILFWKDTIESPGVNTNPQARARASLESRAEQAAARAGRADPPPSNDWVARYPWIQRFHIDYFLGAD